MLRCEMLDNRESFSGSRRSKISLVIRRDVPVLGMVVTKIYRFSTANKSKKIASPPVPGLKNGKKQKSKKKVKSQSLVRQNVERGIELSECALKMAVAIASPFSPMALGACIPTSPARPSLKTSGYIRTTAYVGTAGWGYIAITPCIANDQVSVYYTTVAYTGNQNDYFSPFGATVGALKTGVAGANMTNLPYPSSSFWTNTYPDLLSQNWVQGRIVSVGLSVQYTGTTLNESGTLVCFSHPSHLDIGNLNTSQILAFQDCEAGFVGRKKCLVSSGPVSDEECSYDREPKAAAFSGNNPGSNTFQSCLIYPWSSPGTYNSGNTLAAAPIMVVGFTGVAGSTFYFELVTHAEYVGGGATALSTPNVADPIGLHKVISAVGKVPQMKQANPEKSYGQHMFNALKQVSKELAPVAGAALKAAILASLG